MINAKIARLSSLVLLPRGSQINDHHIYLLQQHGVFLWKEDVLLVTGIVIDETICEIQFIYEKINSGGHLSHSVIQRMVMPKVEKLCVNKNLLDVLLNLRQKDYYTYRHSLGVAVLSYLNP